MGYEDDEYDINQPSAGSSSAVKKQKYCIAKDEDWEYLLASKHGQNCVNLNRTLKLTTLSVNFNMKGTDKKNIRQNSILFPYIRIIHFTLHLLYEDLKLNMLRSQERLPLMKFLYRLSTDMGLVEYKIHYWHDFSDQASADVQPPSISKNNLQNVISSSALSDTPVSIMKYIYELMSGTSLQPYPYLHNVNTRSRDIAQVLFEN